MAPEPQALPVMTRCPVCGGDLNIVRLTCIQCSTSLDGKFGYGRFGRLTREQLAFAEQFIKCRGKIKDLEDELGVSYPTVVGRLNDLVTGMGFEDRQEDDRQAQRRAIVDAVAAGELSAADAAKRLRTL